MTSGVVVAALAVFVAGAVFGIVMISTLASRREDRQLLRNRPQGFVARSGRFVTGLKVDLPDPDAETWDQAGYSEGWPPRPAGRRRRPRRRTSIR